MTFCCYGAVNRLAVTGVNILYTFWDGGETNYISNAVVGKHGLIEVHI
jgi:hypothetical protein